MSSRLLDWNNRLWRPVFRLLYRWEASCRVYWKYVRPYDVAIAAHLMVLVAAKLFGERAGRYVYGRVF